MLNFGVDYVELEGKPKRILYPEAQGRCLQLYQHHLKEKCSAFSGATKAERAFMPCKNMHTSSAKGL